MGNQNSGQVALAHPPAKWTQSFPRDPKRFQRYGAIPENKVLPARIPGQRLRPTENGRSLQIEGTITGRRASEFSVMPNGFNPQVPSHHTASMTALNVPPHSQGPNLRFGPLPKSYTSEPDLRGPSPHHHPSPPRPTQHTIISQSPTKGKIKSKKRFKAPNPPSFPYDKESPRSDYSNDPSFKINSQNSSASPMSSKGKSKKVGLFKKKHESKKKYYSDEDKLSKEAHGGFEVVMGPNDYKSSPRDKNDQDIKITGGVEGASVSVPDHRSNTKCRYSPKEDLRERARSLDCLRQESLNSSPTATSSVSDLHASLNKTIDDTLSKSSNSSEIKKFEQNSTKLQSCQSMTIDRCSRSKSKMEKRVEDKRFESRGHLAYSSMSGPISHVRSLSSTSYHEDLPEEIKKEWDAAEKELAEKKKRVEEMQRQIETATKNLRKVSSEIAKTRNPSVARATESRPDSPIRPLSRSSRRSITNEAKESSPKTFFFGMEPDVSKDSSLTKTSGLAKIKAQECVSIKGSSVEYAKRTLEKNEKRSKSRTRDSSRSSQKSQVKSDQPIDKRKLSRDVDQFAISIGKLKTTPPSILDDVLGNSPRKDDGGYHSRQNSGSFYLETDNNSEDGSSITMNLRPTLPRRQLEIPRFSPNAAWRSLGAEATKQKDSLNESRSSEDSVYEDKIQRHTRPTAPPRGSGEKSADSGISGDAGSPAPIPEFEQLILPGKQKDGPLAVSSPLASGREVRRPWTPAQDLDEHSLDESGENSGKSSVLPGLSTPPKLIPISTMFQKNDAEQSTQESILSSQSKSDDNSSPNESSVYTKTNISSLKKSNRDPTPQKFHSLRKLKRTMSGRKSPTNSHREIRSPEDAGVTEDNWRDNWSMSRSIPNSLNNCDEPDHASNASGRPCRSRSESRTGEADDHTPHSRPRTPSYLQYGSSGHIMYLPEYNSRKAARNASNEEDSYKSSHNGRSNSPTYERKPPSGDENPTLTSQTYGHMSLPPMLVNNEKYFNGKKHKFSYQSTVRIIEKKKLEEKLNREVAEKERKRLQEAQALKEVEEEFQRKREREKQKQQISPKEPQHNQTKPNPYDVNFLPHDHHHTSRYSDQVDFHNDKIDLSSNSSSHHSSRNQQPFQSLPSDLRDSPSPNGSTGLFKGFKSWVKSRKEHRNGSQSGGYSSDASCNTLASSHGHVTSASRQEPDGAPASSPRRKSQGEGFRAEIIAASRQRNGDFNLDEDIYSRKSMSPDSKRLTEELPELIQERREYREYRISKHSHPTPVKHHASTALPGNYRREFAFGNIQSSSPSSLKLKTSDESDRLSRHSSEEKRSEGSGRSVHRTSSTELGKSKSSSYHSSSPTHSKYQDPSFVYNRDYSSSSIDSSPARFANNMLTPFTTSPSYRPVSFSPPPPTKILHVN